MRLVDEAVLDLFRAPGPCEWCKRWCAGGRDPSHVFSRGAGGPDIRVNLCGLCRLCHSSNHWGREPTRYDLLAIAAAREGLLQGQIIEAVNAIRWRHNGRERVP